MNRIARLSRTLIWLAAVGLVAPQAAWADSTAGDPAIAATDVALAAGGVLHGQVLDPQGQPQGKLAVRLVQKNEIVATATTDAQGKFAVADLRGGVYEVHAGASAGVYRLWAANTAPPVAQSSALLVDGQTAVRGQGGFGWLRNPWVIGGIVAAAIAIPIAVSNHDSGSGS